MKTPEEKKATRRKYRQENSQAILAYKRARYASSPEVREARSKAHRIYYENNRQRIIEKQRQYRLDHPFHFVNYRVKLKEDVIRHYGNGSLACVKCGYTNIMALTIDHISGKGAEHRKELSGKNGIDFYVWLRKHNYPEGYQTLCMNCQFIKRVENKEWGS